MAVKNWKDTLLDVVLDCWDWLTGRWNRLMSRKRRIALNLLLTLGVAALAWALTGYPLPGELAFRRLEEQNFLAPSRIVFHQPREHGWSEEARITKSVYLGLGEDWAVTGYVDGRGDYIYWKPLENHSYTTVNVPDCWLELWPLEEEGPALIPLGYPLRGPEEENAHQLGWGVAALRLPQGTAKGELLLEDGGQTHRLEGRILDSGGLYFWLWDDGRDLEQYWRYQELGLEWAFTHTVLGEAWMLGLPYELTVWDETDRELLHQTGNLPRERQLVGRN